MILITYNTEKNIVLTLAPGPFDQYYLFEFISKITGEKLLMLAPTISLTNDFQKFLFKHNGSNPDGGGFILDVGDYNYNVYGTSTFVRSVSAANGLLGVGLMRIMLETDMEYDLEDTRITYYNG